MASNIFDQFDTVPGTAVGAPAQAPVALQPGAGGPQQPVMLPPITVRPRQPPVAVPQPTAPNIFDQFDAPAVPQSAAAPAPNFFDQFDNAPAGAPNPFAQFDTASPETAPNPFAQFDVSAPPDTTQGPRDAATVQAEYAGLPWYKKPLQAADDMVRLAGDNISFGTLDPIVAAITGGNTAKERALTQEARERAGGAGTAMDLVTALGTGNALAGRGATLLGRFGTSAVTGLPGVAARTGLAAAEGAGYGAANAAGHGDDVGPSTLIGALTGGAIHGGTEVLGGVAGMGRRPNVPTRDDIQQRAQAAYNAADNSGVTFTPQGISALANRVQQHLAGMGYDPINQPGIPPILNRLATYGANGSTVQGMDTLRKVAADGYRAGNNSNNSAVSRIIQMVDDSVANPAPGDVFGAGPQAGVGTPGAAQQAASAAQQYQTARDLWSRLRKVDTVENLDNNAELNAGSSGAGANTENARRQQFKTLLKQPTSRGGRGFTPDEQDALRDIVVGTRGSNALRWGGKFAPTGIISTAGGAAIGHSLGGPLGGALALTVPAAGLAAKTAADRIAASRTQNLINLIMAGGNRAALQVPPNAVQRGIAASGPARDAFVRALSNNLTSRTDYRDQ